MAMITGAHSFSLMSLVGLSLCGCDAFVDDGYHGEARGTIAGVIVNERPAPTPAIAVGILWYALGPDPYQPATPLLLDTPVAVSAQFPSGFELQLPTPPRGAIGAFPATGEVYEAEAIVALVAAEATDQAAPGDVIAADEHYALLYLGDDLAAGSIQARLHCGALGAGYHLMERTCDATASCTEVPTYPADDGEQCGNWEAADGLDTVITIHLR
jgi:hypothetical protein